MQRFSSQRLILTVVVFYVILLLLWLKTRRGDSPVAVAENQDDEESLQNVKNATLGVWFALCSKYNCAIPDANIIIKQFEKIFAIGFPDRTDKRDAITLAASILDLDVDWIDGVDYRTMNPKAYPAVCFGIYTYSPSHS